MKKLKILSIFVLTIFILTNSNYSAKVKTGKRVLIHITSNIKTDDGPPCVGFDMALANLMMGNKVEIMFDADAAWNLKISDKDKKNDFGRYIIPADLKQIIKKQFPKINMFNGKSFDDFNRLLYKMGVVITVNGTWNVLTSVEKDIHGKTRMPDYVKPLNLVEMAQHINRAQVYYSY